MTRTLTPNTIREPLLRTLGGLPAGTTVKGSEVIQRMLDNLGVTDPLERERGSNNARWLASQVLRKEGLLSEGDVRGKWTITPEGEKAIRELTGGVAKPEVEAAEDDLLEDLVAEEEPPPSEPEPEPVIVSQWADDTAGECLYPSIPRDTYADDAYIRSLAIGKTPCFGGYDASSTVCGGCPLAGSCVSHQIMRIAKIADGLRKQDEAAAFRANKMATTATTVSDTSRAQVKEEDLDDILNELTGKADPTPTQPPPVDPHRGTKLNATVESRCYQCKGTIPKGGAAIHVPNKGLRHETCT